VTSKRSVVGDSATKTLESGNVVDTFSKRMKTRANAELIKDALVELRTGARISDVVKLTGLSDHIVKRHLTWLTAIREVYYEERTGVYYPNDKLEHPAGDVSFTTLEGRAYRLQITGNSLSGMYVVVQEISKGSDGVPKIQGAIALPLDEASRVLSELSSAAQQFYSVSVTP
jgi:hypothetical protein